MSTEHATTETTEAQATVPETASAAKPAGEKPRKAEAAVVDQVARLDKKVQEHDEHLFGKPAPNTATAPATDSYQCPCCNELIA